MFMTNTSRKREKQSSALPMAAIWRRDGGQSDEDQNEQQQEQLANHSSDNAEIARSLTLMESENCTFSSPPLKADFPSSQKPLAAS